MEALLLVARLVRHTIPGSSCGHAPCVHLAWTVALFVHKAEETAGRSRRSNQQGDGWLRRVQRPERRSGCRALVVVARQSLEGLTVEAMAQRASARTCVQRLSHLCLG